MYSCVVLQEWFYGSGNEIKNNSPQRTQSSQRKPKNWSNPVAFYLES